MVVLVLFLWKDYNTIEPDVVVIITMHRREALIVNYSAFAYSPFTSTNTFILDVLLRLNVNFRLVVKLRPGTKFTTTLN